MLTSEMIEGKHPVWYILEQHKDYTRDHVLSLLYRCEKMYQARADVQRILVQLIKWEFDPDRNTRSREDSEKLLKKIQVSIA
jgi:hypothetical protein